MSTYWLVLFTNKMWIYLFRCNFCCVLAQSYFRWWFNWKGERIMQTVGYILQHKSFLRCDHIYRCSVKFCGRSPIRAAQIPIKESAQSGVSREGENLPHTFSCVHVGYKDLTNRKIWKWLLSELCFIHLCAIDNGLFCTQNFLNVTAPLCYHS